MSLPWLTIRFATVTFVLGIAGIYFLSTYFGFGPNQAFMAIISWLGLVLGYHKYRGDQDESETADDDHLEDAAEAENADTDEDTDSQQRDVDYQTQPAPLGGTSDDNTTDSTPDTTTSSRQLTQSSLLRSNDEIIDEVEDKLDDYVQFYNDESIEIADNDLNLYSRMMLQVIVKRLKYEYGSTDTPKMTVEELRKTIGKNRYDRNNIEVLLFLEAARDWLTPPYRATDIDYAELNETTFTVELKNLSEAVDWTLNDQWDYVGLPSSLRTAAAALNDARNRYESLKEKEDTGYYPGPQENYDKIIYSVLDACSHAQWYPVEVKDDGNWDTFTDSADTLFHYLEEDSPSKIPVCLEPMQRALENMEEQAEEERDW